MRIGRDLNALAGELTRQAEAKQDYIADTRQLEFVPHDEDVRVALDTVGEFGITNHAHRQFGDRCGIPAKYYDRMRKDAPHLLAHNLNHWLKEEPERRMVRTLDGDTRAFLSNRYRPLDNFDLAEAALPVIVEGKAQVESCEVTERKFYLKAILPGVQEEIGPPNTDWKWGEGYHQVHVVQPGIVISNSEVGAGALAVSPAVHTVHCTNLAVWNDEALRKFHLGRNNGNGHHRGDDEAGVWQYMSDDTKRLSDAALWSQVSDLIRASLEGEVFEKIVAEMRQARENPIEGNPVKAVEALSDGIVTVSEEERGGILKHLTTGGDLTQYGLHQAITRTAEDAEDYDRASELEVMGGTIVRLPQSDWRKIAQAA